LGVLFVFFWGLVGVYKVSPNSIPIYVLLAHNYTERFREISTFFLVALAVPHWFFIENAGALGV